MKNCIKAILTAIICISMVTVFTVKSYANKSDLVELSTTKPGAVITDSALNVRTGPSTSFGILCTVPYGTKLMAIERCTNNWYKVQYDIWGSVGYVSGTYVTEYSLDYYCRVNSADPLRLRETPNINNNNIITALSNGTYLPELLYLNSSWDYVLYGNRDGYMATPYLIRDMY